MNDHAQPLPQSAEASVAFIVTIFPDQFAASKSERQFESVAAFAEWIGSDDSLFAETKAKLPFIKLARFGDRRSNKNCLRTNANIIAITGCEGDYDGGEITPEQAFEVLKENNITGVIYTSASHRPDKPRWRVALPFSREYEGSTDELHATRTGFLARFDNLIGNKLARESYTLSQSYYVGETPESEDDFKVLCHGGDFIDLRDDLEPVQETTALARALGEWRNAATEVLQDALSHINADDYDIWLKVGMALHNEFRGGAVGLALWDQWSQASDKYKPGECKAKWEGFTFDGGVTLGTLVHLAREGGWTGQLRAVATPDVEPTLDFAAAAVDAGSLTSAPEPQVWTWHPWIPEGVVTGLAGAAGVAKSTLALQLCIHKALGLPLFPDAAGDGEMEPGSAVFATTEDDLKILHWRVRKICARLDVDVRALTSKLTLLPLAAEAPMLVSVDRDERVFTTEHLTQLEAFLAAKRVSLLVLDLLNDYWPGTENSRAQVTPFIRKHLGGMASRLKCGLVGLSHPSVAAMNDGRIFAGSTAVVGSVRSGISMVRGENDMIKLTVEKANYAKPGHSAMMRWEDGYLEHVTVGEMIGERQAQSDAMCQVVLDVLRDRRGEWLSRDDVWLALGAETKKDHGRAAKNKTWVEARLLKLTRDKATVQREGVGTNRNKRREWAFLPRD